MYDGGTTTEADMATKIAKLTIATTGEVEELEVLGICSTFATAAPVGSCSVVLTPGGWVYVCESCDTVEQAIEAAAARATMEGAQ